LNNGRKTLVDILFSRAQNTGSKNLYTFLQDGITESSNLTYQDLLTHAHHLAAHLPTNNTKQIRAIIAMPPGIRFIEIFFACLLKRIIAVPVYPPGLRKESSLMIRSIIQNSGASCVITNSFYLKHFSELDLPGLDLINADEIIFQEKEHYATYERPTENDIAFLQYTSGSSGNPKGVIIKHKNLTSNLSHISKRFGHSNESQGVIWLPPYHDMGLIGGILQPVYAGFPVVLMPPSAFIQKPILWLRAIDKYKATTSGGPNFAYDYCVQRIQENDRAALDLSSWKVAFNGAEPVRNTTIDRFSQNFAIAGFSKSAFYPCYGLAEATLFVSGHHYSENGKDEITSCGQVLSDTTVVIYDMEKEQPALPGESGEILLHGPGMSDGYWNSVNQLYLNLNNINYIRTGDIGFIRSGELCISGRLKDIIIIRGKNFIAEEIENTLKTEIPDLIQNKVACFSSPGQNTENLIIAVELLRSQEGLSFHEITKHIYRLLFDFYEISPFHILFVAFGQLPVTHSGKIRKYLCKEKYLSGLFTVKYEEKNEKNNEATDVVIPIPQWHQTDLATLEEEISKTLIIKLSHVSGVDKIDPEEDISVLGIDSMELTTLSLWIEESFEIKFPPEYFYRKKNVKAVAALISKLQCIRSLSLDITKDDPFFLTGDNLTESSKSTTQNHTYRMLSNIEAFPEIIESSLQLKALENISPSPFCMEFEHALNGKAIIHNREMINFSSNDYLGFSGNSKIKKAVIAGIEKYGTSVSASRLVGGEDLFTGNSKSNYPIS
jgi:acyl-CoA synthetase (AMP-forming)/AMP-acid ligase II/acyl carrier protein